MSDIGILANRAEEIATEFVEQTLMSNPELTAEVAMLQFEATKFINLVPEYILEDPSYITKHVNQLKASVEKEYNEQEVINALQNVRQLILDSADLVTYNTAKTQFMTVLNQFLGQKIKVLYVYNNSASQTITLTEVNSDEILTYDAYRKNLRYIPSKRSGLWDLIQDKGKKISEPEAQGLNTTYFEILSRGRKIKKKIRQDLHLSNMFFIYWLEHGTYQHAQISSEGDINEAYVNFYLHQLFHLFNADIENNISKFVRSPYGLKGVDNISGVLQGDITIGDIEYAIKSRGASVLGDTDIIAIAYLIINSPPNELTMAFINDIKTKLADQKQATRTKINQAISKDIGKILKSFQQGLNKN